MKIRNRWPDPQNPGQFLGRDTEVGSRQAARGASGGGFAPVATMGNMNPIIKGRVATLSHLSGGKEASKNFVSGLPQTGYGAEAAREARLEK